MAVRPRGTTATFCLTTRFSIPEVTRSSKTDGWGLLLLALIEAEGNTLIAVRPPAYYVSYCCVLKDRRPRMGPAGLCRCAAQHDLGRKRTCF